jgi:uncharacterized protein (DUF1810 family)
MHPEHHQLDRFVTAQSTVYPYDRVLLELGSGRKVGNWIWFVFPQLIGLGRSPMSQRYGIRHLEEAKSYFDHPLLGERLVECSELLLSWDADTLYKGLSGIDTKKIRSCMTLFEAATDNQIFESVLSKHYKNIWCGRTLRILDPTGFE